jgi:hypothetical protein
VIAIFFVALVAAGALVYVFRPLTRRQEPGRMEESLAIEEASARKETALRAIVDLEEEHAVGKLSWEDMESLRPGYEADAARAMAELDEVGGGAEDDELEAEIAAMRERMTCPNCGALRAPGEACSECGFLA